jgi:hypothetical protein
MNRDTFNRIYGHSSISESEMDRKYRVFIREKEELEIYEAAMTAQRLRSTAGGGSVGDNTANTYVDFDYVEDYVV